LIDFSKGTSEALKQSVEIKEAFETALSLSSPPDATTANLLGAWHFYFADMSYTTRYAAKVLFGTPPSSTYEDALK
jgi:hypothetical protein